MNRQQLTDIIDKYTLIGAKCLKPYSKNQVGRFVWQWVKDDKPFDESFDTEMLNRIDNHQKFWLNKYKTKLGEFEEKTVGQCYLESNSILFKSNEHMDYRVISGKQNPPKSWVKAKVNHYCQERHANIDIVKLLTEGNAEIIIRPHL